MRRRSDFGRPARQPTKPSGWLTAGEESPPADEGGRRRLDPRVTVLVAVLVVSVAALGLLFSREPARDGLGGYAEASLYYPGSVLLRTGHHASTSEAVAQTWKQLGSDASLLDIQAYYEHELAGRGWVPGGGSSGILGTSERGICVWHNDKVVIRLSFWKPQKWRARYPADPSYRTVYELALIERTSPTDPTACAKPLD